MFLQDFDLHFLHLPGSAMGPADALSRLPDLDTSLDNANITVLPDDLFIHAIDTTLVDKITASLPSDPLVVSALQNLSVGSPLFPHSSLADWHLSDLLLQYITKTVFTSLPTPTMLLFPQCMLLLLPVTVASSVLTLSFLGITGGWACCHSSDDLLLAAPVKDTRMKTNRLLSSCLFRRAILTKRPTSS